MKPISKILFAALIFISCNQQEKNAPVSEPAKDSTPVAVEAPKPDSVIVSKPTDDRQIKIIDMLKKLPETKRSDKYLDSLTNHQSSLSYMIFPPEKGEKDYYVKAGYSGKERFETYYNFYVDSAKLTIRIDDVIEGDIISLEQWRKREKARK